jgi:hypothetical protein
VSRPTDRDAAPTQFDGPATVVAWIRLLHRGAADHDLWRALTHDLRLTVCQLYLMSVGSLGDEARAARLASVESAENDFPHVLRRQCQAWRKAFLPLALGIASADGVAVGADMEMVTVTARPVRPGRAGLPHARYRFLVLHHRRGAAIAAFGHRLPVPGWPPTQWSIPHL